MQIQFMNKLNYTICTHVVNKLSFENKLSIINAIYVLVSSKLFF